MDENKSTFFFACKTQFISSYVTCGIPKYISIRSIAYEVVQDLHYVRLACKQTHPAHAIMYVKAYIIANMYPSV